MVVAFVPQLVSLLLIIGLFLVFLRKLRTGVIVVSIGSLICLVLLIMTVQPFSKIKTMTIRPGELFTVAFFNVLYENQDYSGVLDHVENLSPDLIVLQEASRSWMLESLRLLGEEYPFHFAVNVKSCYLQQIIFSKFPINNPQVNYFDGYPMFMADLYIRQKQVRLYSFHAMVPFNKSFKDRRNNQIKDLGSMISQEKELPVLFAGDLNSVPWDPAILKLKSETGLIDSRRSFDYTFAVKAPFLRVPIDYLMHNSQVSCINFGLLSTSSDHHGLVGEYVLDF